MLARLSFLFLAVVSCCLASCATPRTSQGLIAADVDGDGLPDSVALLNLVEDKEAVLLHLQKIDVRKKAQVLADQGYARVKQLHAGGRVGPLELLGSEARLATASIDLIDAKVALARTGLLSDLTFIDTDDDGIPDLLHTPIDADELLDEKVKLCRALFEQRSHSHEQAKSLHKTGVASSDDVDQAAQQMYEAELDWLNARMERQQLPDSDAR
ncbi:MAG: hypothetical protein ACI89X_002385 [Planctomycetota bacterium]|jgi:hypothetical protein